MEWSVETSKCRIQDSDYKSKERGYKNFLEVTVKRRVLLLFLILLPVYEAAADGHSQYPDLGLCDLRLNDEDLDSRSVRTVELRCTAGRISWPDAKSVLHIRLASSSTKEQSVTLCWSFVAYGVDASIRLLNNTSTHLLHESTSRSSMCLETSGESSAIIEIIPQHRGAVTWSYEILKASRDLTQSEACSPCSMKEIQTLLPASELVLTGYARSVTKQWIHIQTTQTQRATYFTKRASRVGYIRMKWPIGCDINGRDVKKINKRLRRSQQRERLLFLARTLFGSIHLTCSANLDVNFNVLGI